MREQAKITSKGQITVRKKSVFAKYRGIGNPGISSGRNAIIRKTRELREDKERRK